jgi:hypothetical protein
VASDQGWQGDGDGVPFLAGKTNAIPDCFYKCAQANERKRVAEILVKVVCAKCSEATEKAMVK